MTPAPAKAKRQPTESVLPPAAEQIYRVVANTEANPEYRHLTLQAPAPLTDAVAGQFFHLLCPASGTDRPFLRRPMSFYRIDPGRRRLEFLYKVVGAGTRGLATLAPNDRLNILGPLGVGFRLEERWKTIVVVGRGVGLATLAPLARMARARGLGVTAILSARRPDLIMSADVFAAEGATVVTVSADASGDVDGSASGRALRVGRRGIHEPSLFESRGGDREGAWGAAARAAVSEVHRFYKRTTGHRVHAPHGEHRFTVAERDEPWSQAIDLSLDFTVGRNLRFDVVGFEVGSSHPGSVGVAADDQAFNARQQSYRRETTSPTERARSEEHTSELQSH